jgi:hypothetical protein
MVMHLKGVSALYFRIGPHTVLTFVYAYLLDFSSCVFTVAWLAFGSGFEPW